MKMTNVAAYDYLFRMRELNETGKLGYAIAKNMRKIQTEIQEYIEKRDGAANKYGNVKEDGSFQIPPENVEAYLAEFADLGEIENDIDIMTVDTDTFCSGSLTSQDMYLLEWMESKDQ